MNKTPKTFEECYFLTSRSNISVKKIEYDISENRENISKYQENIFCPECQHARLSFVSKTSKRKAHLRAINKYEHQNCSYFYEYATREQITKYLNELTDEQIKDKMNAIMNMLCKRDMVSSLDKPQEISNDTNPMLIKSADNNSNYLYKAIRIKSLQGWLEVDSDQLYIFYGKVKLNTKKIMGKNGEFYVMNICVENRHGSWNKKVSISSNEDFSNIDESKIYRMVVIGKLDTQYMKINLYRKNSFKYEMI